MDLVPTHTNIAFKCTYCDGGRSDDRVGFCGICSDGVLRAHIGEEHQSRCIASKLPCFRYFSQEITRAELDALGQSSSAVCRESRLLRDWRVPAGLVQHGGRRGTSMHLKQVRENSLGILTTCGPRCPERSRYIFGVFLVDGPCESVECVRAKPEERIELAPAEADQLLFWRYHANANKPDMPIWNASQHRYLDDIHAAMILRDIAQMKRGTQDEARAEKLFARFCAQNQLDPDQIGAPDGAIAPALSLS